MEFKCKILDVEKFNESIGFVTDKDFVKSLRLKQDQYLNIETWQERNIFFHKKFFAFLNAAIYLLPEDKKYDNLRNLDYLRKKLMIIIGEVEEIIGLDGQIHLQANSISFKSMDEERFSEIYSACTRAVLKYFLHGISMKDFENTIANFL